MAARRCAAVALACAAALGGSGVAGCGSDDESGAPTAVQAPTTGAEPAQTAHTEDNSVTVTTGPTATTGVPKGGGAPGGEGESGEGGAGDEEAARVPVVLTAAGPSLSPTTVTVPAFLTLEVTVIAAGGPQSVTIDAPGGGTVKVAAGQRATKRLSGLKPGDYAVTTQGGGKAVLHVVSGGDPGP